MRAPFPIVLTIAASAVVGGCTTYEHPTIDITSARMTDATDEAASLNFGLHLHNPNNEPLTLLDFEYTMNVDGRQVFEGKRAAETTLAARGSKNVAIPAVIPYEAAEWLNGLPPEARYQLKGKLRYLTPGKIFQVLFDLGVRRPTVGFSDAGVVVLGENIQSPNGQNLKTEEPRVN
jgi:LEA14-like dessication related protein